VLAHSPSLNQTRWDLNSDYSDRFLGDQSGANALLSIEVLPLRHSFCVGSGLDFGEKGRS
jgi:hypothetical protein